MKYLLLQRYGPMKIEIVSLKPYIAVIHNFINNLEVEELISKAKKNLKRSAVAAYNKGILKEFDERRSSQQAWINEKMSGAAKNITKRLDEFLDVEAVSELHSEPYQGNIVDHF